MKTLELKLTRIGNSKGIRLPVDLIQRYGFSESLAAEIREEGLLLKPKKNAKLSWAETARDMAASDEDWSEWDATVADGLETCPWNQATTSKVRVRAELPTSSKRRAKKRIERRSQR